MSNPSLRGGSVPRKPVAYPPYTEYLPAHTNDDGSDSTLARERETGELQQYRWRNVLLSIVFLSVPILFTILGIMAWRLNGKTENNRGRKIMNAILLTPSSYPVIFAVIVGNCVKSLALYLAQRGTTLGQLEQIISSSTLGATLSTAFLLRKFNFSILLLVVLWSLSPLGGQAALRMVTIAPRISATNSATIWYRSGDDDPLIYNYIGDDGKQIEATYTSNMFAVKTAQNSPVDIFGNLKIPMIERLDPLSADKDGWFPVPSSNVIWSSLTGIPFQGARTLGNGTFTIQARYTYLDCGKPVNTSVSALPRSMQDSVTEVEANSTTRTVYRPARTMWLNMTDSGWLSGRHSYIKAATEPRKLSFVSGLEMALGVRHFSYSTCSSTETYVEAGISCSGPSCAVTSLRTSLLDHIPSYISRWDGRDYLTNELQTRYFSKAASLEGTYYSSATERYIENPNAPQRIIGAVNMVSSEDPPPDLTILSAETFSTRLTTAYNTYFNGYLNRPSVISGTAINLANLTNPTPDTPDLVNSNAESPEYSSSSVYQYGTLYSPANKKTPYLARKSEGTWIEFQPMYIYNWRWALVYFFSVGVLGLVVLIGIVLQSTRKAPEFLLTVGGVLRDSRYVKDERLLSGSWMDGTDNTRKAWDMKVAIRDVKAGEPVGRVALVGGEASDWGELKLNKRYE